jgi:NAD(P)H dehydrogenase (quinone)
VKTLLVVAHPRRTSLTFAAAEGFAKALSATGGSVEWADLVREGFDPSLGVADEPDWNDPAKRYSAAVTAEMERIRRNDATVLMFPVWWWYMPAILKGWIDRVWNHGFAYGGVAYPHRRVWMIAIAGAGEEAFRKRGYDEAMRVQLEIGVLDYSGVVERRLEVLYGAIEGREAAVIERASALGAEFASPR